MLSSLQAQGGRRTVGLDDSTRVCQHRVPEGLPGDGSSAVLGAAILTEAPPEASLARGLAGV